MSDAYDFFDGPASGGTPAAGAEPFRAGQPSGAPEQTAPGYGSTFGTPVGTSAPLPAAAVVTAAVGGRPGPVSVASGLLVLQAALLAVPGVLLLLVRDVVNRVLDAMVSAAQTFGGLETAGLDAGSAPTTRLTLWGALLVLTAAATAVAGIGLLGRHAWAWLVALVAQAAVLVGAVIHVADYPSVAGLAIATAVAAGALLAVPTVRTWCAPA